MKESFDDVFGNIYTLEGATISIFDPELFSIRREEYGSEQEARKVFNDKREETEARLRALEEQNRETERQLNVTFATREKAEQAMKEWGRDTRMVQRYECMECGCRFYAVWRSSYNKMPACPRCPDSDDLFVREVLSDEE